MGCCPFHVSFYASLNYNWTITLTFFSFLSFSKFSRNYLSSMNIRVVTYRAMELKKNWRYFIETVFENTYNFFFFIYIYLNLVLFIPVSRNRYQPIVFIYLFLQSWASKVITYLNGTSSTIIIITFRIIENYRSNLVIRNRLWLLNFADRRYARAGKNRKQTIITLEIQPPPSSTDCAYSILRNWLHSISTLTSSTHRAADIQRAFLFLEQNCSNGASNGAFIALLLVIRILARFFYLLGNWKLNARSIFLPKETTKPFLEGGQFTGSFIKFE